MNLTRPAQIMHSTKVGGELINCVIIAFLGIQDSILMLPDVMISLDVSAKALSLIVLLNNFFDTSMRCHVMLVFLELRRRRKKSLVNKNKTVQRGTSAID